MHYVYADVLLKLAQDHLLSSILYHSSQSGMHLLLCNVRPVINVSNVLMGVIVLKVVGSLFVLGEFLICPYLLRPLRREARNRDRPAFWDHVRLLAYQGMTVSRSCHRNTFSPFCLPCPNIYFSCLRS